MSTKLTHEFLIKRRSVGPGKEQAEMSLLITLLSGICELSTLPDALKHELPTAGVRGRGGGGGVGVDESQLSCKRINILTVIGVVLAESGVLIYVWIKIN